jgi:SAM-dependent methyltransferase
VSRVRAPLEILAEAYDRAAPDYDRQVQGDAWMRQVLWERYGRLFRPGQVVLDVGCGTGIDALFLANRGIRVVGIDASGAMVTRARAKLADDRLEDRVELRVMDISDIGALERDFDGIISAFASLSSGADLDRFAADAALLLRPRGTMLLHLLNRSSLWEWLGLVRHGRWPAARRVWRRRERDFAVGSRRVPHYLYHAREAYARFFRPRFRLGRAYGLGILRPPHTLHGVPAPIVTLLDALERPLRARRPFVNWGRLWVLELEKR